MPRHPMGERPLTNAEKQARKHAKDKRLREAADAVIATYDAGHRYAALDSAIARLRAARSMQGEHSP